MGGCEVTHCFILYPPQKNAQFNIKLKLECVISGIKISLNNRK